METHSLKYLETPNSDSTKCYHLPRIERQWENTVTVSLHCK